MCTRILFALTACALVLPGGFVEAQDEPITAERICQFEVQVPVVLTVGECVPQEDGSGVLLDVITNSRINLSITGTDFKRTERDCDGNLLDTVDVLEGGVDVAFSEVVHCPDGGAELQVKDNGDNTWCLAPHRGGFRILLDAAPQSTQDLCDDAGCYVAEVRILINAEPAEDCP